MNSLRAEHERAFARTRNGGRVQSAWLILGRRRLRLFIPHIVAGALIGSAAAEAGAQAAPQVIAGPPACATCRIERVRTGSIDDRSVDGGAITIGGYVHANRDSTYLVVTGPGWDELYHVSRTGTAWRRIGRNGEGPGEYRNPMQIMESRDAYLVADARLHRITYLNKRTLTPTRTVTVPGVITGITPAVFSDGGYVMFGSVQTREGAGLSLHSVSPTGKLLASFAPRARGTPSPRLAASGDTAVWVVHQDYTIELWSRQGRLLHSYRRTADWIIPREQERRPQPGLPVSTIQGVREDGAGRLWITGTTSRRDSGGMLGDPDPATRASYIEVLDVRSRRVWAQSVEQGVRAVGMHGHGPHYLTRRESASGEIILDLWTARIVNPTTREDP